MVTMNERAVTTIEPMTLAQIAQEHGEEGLEHREAVFEVRDLAVDYSGNTAIHGVSLDVYKNSDHGLHRAVGLRQEHASSAASTG